MTGSQGTDPGQQILLAKILLERGLLTPAQLREALAGRSPGGSDSGDHSLESILVARGYLTRPKIEEVLAELAGRSPQTTPPSRPQATAPAASRPQGPPSSAALSRLGKYTLIRELGRGGMGAVYEALDVQLNRKVALKLMIPHPSANPREAAVDEERFIREAKLAAQLKHPNIVSVYEAGVIEGRRFLAMELIEGKPFSTWRKQGSLTVRQQVAALRDVALAVHYAHEQSVLHRDLKPRNVLVDGNDHPFVTDFGLAKTLGKDTNVSLTASGMVVGTPTYMSPEQCQGTGRIDWRSDIWSLGVMLYEILTGRTPFGGDAPMDIMTKVVRDPVPPPSKVALDAAALALDSTIENICLKALAKEPKERYPTAKVFADDLSRWITGQSVKVSAPKVRKLPRRTFLEVAIFATVVAAAAGFYLWTRPSVTAELERARVLMEKGEYMEAVISFREALARDPGNKKALAGEAEARRKMADKETRDRKEYEEKAREMERARREAEEKERAMKAATSITEKERLETERRRAEERLRSAAFELDAFRRRTNLPSLPNPDVPSPPRHEASWNEADSLIPLVDPLRDTQWGMWSLRDGILGSDPTAHARIEIPYEPPEEYDIRMSFSRRGGTDCVSLILPCGGTFFAWEMGASGNSLLTLVPPGARDAGSPATSHRTPCLVNRRPYTTIVRVRRDGVQAFLDDQPAAEWKGSPSQLGADPRWKLRDGKVLGVGSHASPTDFHSIEILAVTGRGRRAVPAPSPPLRSPAVDPASFQPGLIGEYYYGTSHGTLALRRIDPSVSFNWDEGPAWPNGPANAFSVRWSGYLNSTKGGPVAFALTADGASRLLVDGQQVLATDASRRGATHSAVWPLEPGFHALAAEFFECGFRAAIQLAWAEQEGKKPSVIGPASLFHDPAAFEARQARPPHEFFGILASHTNNITGVAFGPQGQTLVSTGEDGKLKIWDTERRHLQDTRAGHTWGILATAFSPDGRFIASGGYDCRIRLWDAQKRSDLRTFTGHQGYIRALAFSPDSRKLASGSHDRTILLWDTTTGREIRMVGAHLRSCTAVAFSPGGSLLASAGEDQSIRLWNLESGQEERRYSGHADSVEGLAFSPDGRTLVSASRDSTLKFWDVAKGTELRTLTGHQGEVSCVAFHPDGKVIASGGQDAIVRIWDVETGNEVRALPGHAGRVTSLCFAPGGRMLASGSHDTTVRLWECGPRQK